MIHHDLKPDNVLLRLPGRTGGGLPDVVLADTGLSEPESQTHPGWGCKPYMSPECLHRTVPHLSHETDIYSFGVMMEQMLNHCSNRYWPMFQNPRTVVIDVEYRGLGFTDMLKKCLETRVSDRGDFSGFKGKGMLWDVLKFREKRSARLQKGEKIDESYWAANRR